MTALLSRRKEITLEDLALHYGPVELQRPLSKEEFTALAERYPDLDVLPGFELPLETMMKKA